MSRKRKCACVTVLISQPWAIWWRAEHRQSRPAPAGCGEIGTHARTEALDCLATVTPLTRTCAALIKFTDVRTPLMKDTPWADFHESTQLPLAKPAHLAATVQCNSFKLCGWMWRPFSYYLLQHSNTHKVWVPTHSDGESMCFQTAIDSLCSW